MLDVRGLTVRYGPILGVEDVSLTVKPGEVVALLGANGAGKSSTLNAVAGVIRPAAGEVWWQGRQITGASAQQIVRKGISLVPENRQLFPELTVHENLRLGAYSRRDRAGIAEDLETVYGYFPVLRDRPRQHAGTMSGGEQQMLAIGRALMARPKLLLLDEPSLGLAPQVIERILTAIRDIAADQGLGVLLVEQNAAAALAIAEEASVLEAGRLVLSGTAAAVRGDPSLQEAFLSRAPGRDDGPPEAAGAGRNSQGGRSPEEAR
jgi:branched-chain amino acid transport system ATP-binding protein